ncbi:hypothetical protein BX667DRAFT_508691 [Coemansia mojavensis]|nr:hypothetical protein BX667DRAFT_508691 [Coemansia mojavensis]
MRNIIAVLFVPALFAIFSQAIQVNSDNVDLKETQPLASTTITPVPNKLPDILPLLNMPHGKELHDKLHLWMPSPVARPPLPGPPIIFMPKKPHSAPTDTLEHIKRQDNSQQKSELEAMATLTVEAMSQDLI